MKKKNKEYIVSTENTEIDTSSSANENIVEKPKKKRLATLRAALVCLAIFTLLCGIIYPLSVTLIAQTAFPYEANGSIIKVTLKDGTKRVYGSELIGQSYESAEYLFGRVNTGAPTNLSPESEEFIALLNERILERKEKLAAIGYIDTAAIPAELITSSGSGVDPHLSPEAAYFQIDIIVTARNLKANSDDDKISADYVKRIIDKYTEGRFLGIFGEKRVNVLLVNLALDGLV